MCSLCNGARGVLVPEEITEPTMLCIYNPDLICNMQTYHDDPIVMKDVRYR